MVRGVPWDDLPGVKVPIGQRNFAMDDVDFTVDSPQVGSGDGALAVPRDFKKDAREIGRHIVFGGVIGGLTGVCFGSVDVVKDVKGMVAKRKEAVETVMRYSYRFGAFYSAFQGVLHAAELYSGQPRTNNILGAAFVTIAPMAVVPSLRSLMPYSALLVVLDAVSSQREGKL
jgi:hypothetical protein